ncbi:MAG: NAD(P)H-dependent oxidoreductase [Flavobacteriales bacterium]|nr:NAD(P)H-dependent oxidoreductase [Flavobacteriales bacterium]
MKRILAISGSASDESSNTVLLESIKVTFKDDFSIEVYEGLWHFPLFSPQLLVSGIPAIIQEFKQKVSVADSVIISTPEYLHNIPAALKNALEWMTESGELVDKPVLASTFTPAPPRGEYAMLSLLQSLKASKAKVVAELPLYRNQLKLTNAIFEFNENERFLLNEALLLL